MSRRAILLVLTTATLSGCGLKRVSSDVLQRLPLESTFQVLEAENDLYIAIDRYDEATDRALHTREEIRRARKRIGEAEDALSRAEESNDPRQVEVAELSVEEACQKRDWLDSWVDVQWALVDVDEANLDAARARYEYSKAIIAKKANVAGSENLDIAAFEAQVKGLEERAKAIAADAEADRKSAEEIRAKWNATRRALAQKTGGALGSPWVE